MIAWPLARPAELRRRGVLGMNRRNAEMVAEHNPRRLYPLVDDKRRTKELAQAAGIAVPELYGVIEIEHQVRSVPRLIEPYEEFVVKPARGSGGSGILVVSGRRGEMLVGTDEELLVADDVARHCSNILSGMYSLGGHADQALLEYRVRFDPLFTRISYRGVPDIRTVVYRGVPVMAMVRLPTRRARGKANLHQGAVGAGIDLHSGRTTFAVCRDRPVERHPDTLEPVRGVEIPGWEDLLVLAARCHDLAGLGYLGVDVVLDRDRGPLILELNARPGLSIQIANREGLLPRLRRVDAERPLPDGAEERAALARRLFAA